MEKITIERNEYGGFIVRQGDRFAELTFDEALATVCALMMQDSDVMPQRFLNWMKTEEEERKWRESLNRVKDEPLFEEVKSMENNFTWNRWSERKPEEGQHIMVVIKDQLFKGSTSFRFMGNAMISHIENSIEDILDDTYWIELPE